MDDFGVAKGPHDGAEGETTASGNFWNDPQILKAAVSGNYMKFSSPGDHVKGTIEVLGKHTWDDGSVAIQVRFVEPDVPTVTASQVMLQKGLFALKPLAGEVLEVELTDVERLPAGKTLKRFRITVTRADGAVETFPGE